MSNPAHLVKSIDFTNGNTWRYYTLTVPLNGFTTIAVATENQYQGYRTLVYGCRSDYSVSEFTPAYSAVGWDVDLALTTLGYYSS